MSRDLTQEQWEAAGKALTKPLPVIVGHFKALNNRSGTVAGTVDGTVGFVIERYFLNGEERAVETPAVYIDLEKLAAALAPAIAREFTRKSLLAEEVLA